MRKVKKVAVTGAAGQIAYSLLFRIANGDLLGPNVDVELRLLDIEAAQDAMKGVAMELMDCAFEKLTKISIHTDPNEAFKGVDWALLVGAKPRGPGMERNDLLVDNGKIFIEQGKALNEVGTKNTKVLVIGNPCNTNCWITMKQAANLPRENFFALTTLDENRAKAQLADKSNSAVRDIEKVIIWGNHSATQVPDYTHATVEGKQVIEIISDSQWLNLDFMETVQKRGAAIISKRGKSSAASAANAIVDCVRSIEGVSDIKNWFSVAKYSKENSYGIDPDLIFSFPCRRKSDGTIEIVEGLEVPEFIQKKITHTEKELKLERATLETILVGEK